MAPAQKKAGACCTRPRPWLAHAALALHKLDHLRGPTASNTILLRLSLIRCDASSASCANSRAQAS